MNLYELSSAIRESVERYAGVDGEIEADSEACLDAIELAFTDKVEACLAVSKELETDAAAIKAEADRLYELSRRREKASDRLTDYMVRCIDLSGAERVKTRLGTVRVQAAGVPSIRWVGDGDIPERYQRIKIELNGSLAQRELKGGGTLPDGFEVTRSRHLRVS